MLLSFIRAANGARLSKSFTLETDGTITSEPYPLTKYVSSEDVEVDSIEAFHAALKTYGSRGWCLLKGQTTRPLNNESRQNSHDPFARTQWLVVDFDALPGAETCEQALNLLGPAFQNVSYIFQPSASHGVACKDGFSAHLFFMLDQPVSPQMLKQWFIRQNLDHDHLSQAITLAAGGRGLRWALDPSVADNSKLIFIAPPSFYGMDDPVPLDQRFQLVRNARDRVNLDLTTLDTQGITARRDTKLVELRKAAGLRNTEIRTRQVRGLDVITNADAAMVVETKLQGGWVRLNLAGENPSWGYWHPAENYEVIYSFKDDTAYLASKFVPEYYAGLQQERAAQAQEDNIELVKIEGERAITAFRDVVTDAYFMGTYDLATGRHDLMRTNRRSAVDDFFIEHQATPPEHLPSLRYVLDFSSPKLIDFENKLVNRYQPPPSFTAPTGEQGEFPTIRSIIDHVLAYDTDSITRFLNWVACIIQLRRPPRTAWILHGVPGTGKGLLFHHILTPLIGAEYCNVRRLQDFQNRFNAFNANAILELVDEADMEALIATEGILSASIKDCITEPALPYEAKGVQRVTLPNFCSYIFASNTHNPVHIEENDRRFNVPPRQETPYGYHEGIRARISAELPAFYEHIMAMEVDVTAASTVMVNDAVQELKRQSLSSMHDASYSFRHGDTTFFLEQLPDEPPLDPGEALTLSAYEAVVDRIMQHGAGEHDVRLSRDKAEALFRYVDPKTPRKNKFTTMLRKHGLHNKPLWIGERTQRGYEITFTINPEDVKNWQAYVAQRQNTKLHAVETRRPVNTAEG